MGKCKRRTLTKPVLKSNIKREDAIKEIVEKIQANMLDAEAKKLLSLFGITPEELTEAGATYEEAIILKKHM